MNGIEAVGSIGAGSIDPIITRLGIPAAAAPAQASQVNFSELMASGMRHVDEKVGSANALVRQFALDDSVPLHQVTYALEEARMTVELAMQVRGRLVESFREMMNMQL